MSAEEPKNEQTPPVDSEAADGSSAEALPRLVFGRNPRWTIIRLGVLILAAFITFKFALMPVRVTGTSMYPGYRDGDINFINRWSFLRSEPQRGDVVGIWEPEQNAIFLKRIVGLPGESLVMERGWILIDGEPLEEDYLHDPRDWTTPLADLGENEYFVMGDNRSTSFRAHYMFRVTREQILGKALFDKTVRSEAK